MSSAFKVIYILYSVVEYNSIIEHVIQVVFDENNFIL